MVSSNKKWVFIKKTQQERSVQRGGIVFKFAESGKVLLSCQMTISIIWRNAILFSRDRFPQSLQSITAAMSCVCIVD